MCRLSYLFLSCSFVRLSFQIQSPRENNNIDKHQLSFSSLFLSLFFHLSHLSYYHDDNEVVLAATARISVSDEMTSVFQQNFDKIASIYLHCYSSTRTISCQEELSFLLSHLLTRRSGQLTKGAFVVYLPSTICLSFPNARHAQTTSMHSQIA